MSSFLKDLLKNEFGTTLKLVLSDNEKISKFLRCIFLIWFVSLIIVLITVPISTSRHSKKKIDIEQAYYNEYSDSCTVTYTIENRNKSNLMDFTLRYSVKDKNTGKTIYSQDEYVGYLFKTVDSDKDHFSINFKTTQVGVDGKEYRTSYSDMVIEYKIIKANFSDGFLLYIIMYMSIVVVGLPLVYYFGKFSFVVFPICFYVYSNNIRNCILRNFVRLIFLIPFLWGAMLCNKKDVKGMIAVDIDGNEVGIYDPETGLITKDGKVVVPIQKKSINKK